MEKYLKKKRTMNECLRDSCESEKEFHSLLKAEKLEKANNFALSQIIYTPKRSKEVTSLNETCLLLMCLNIKEKQKNIKTFQNNLISDSVYNNEEYLKVVEFDVEEKIYEKNRIEFVKSHPEYYPVLSTLDFESLRKRMTEYKLKQPTIQELAEEFNVCYNIMYRAIKFVLNLKYLKCSRLNVKSESKLNDLQFLLFYKYFIDFLSEDKEFLFIDEASFNNSKRGGMKWVEPNSKNVILDKVRVSGVNLILCSSKDGMVYYEILNTTVDSTRFTKFIDQLIIKISENIVLFNKYKSGKYVLVLDNASCHVSKQTFDHIKFKKFNVLTLPPYSPYYNVSEYMFNWLKKKFYSMNFSKK